MDDQARERFEALAGKVVEPVRRFLARRTDRDTADDVLAETLLVCWRRLDEVPDLALPWVYGVARLCQHAERADGAPPPPPPPKKKKQPPPRKKKKKKKKKKQLHLT